jgi:inorganic pyrophosphatase
VTWLASPRSSDGFTLAVSPSGRFRLLESPDAPSLDSRPAEAIAAAFAGGAAAGLFHLGAVEVSTPLPPALGFFRDFARLFVARLCHRRPRGTESQVDVPVPPGLLDRVAGDAPPLAGGEYIDAARLQMWWAELQGFFREEIRRLRGSVQSYLQAKNSVWNLVGRVYFHLAENKADSDHPFAFLATYTTRLSGQARPQHQPLGQALRTFAMTSPEAFRPHPWHGIDPGPRFPELLVAYIEIVPTDGVKYEIDKHSGYLMVDRPQRFSSFCPSLYGFVPRTLCAHGVASYPLHGSPVVDRGDRDPLDICVLTDRPISRGEILLEARPVGGLRMVERGEADDKIIAVLAGDPTYGDFTDVTELPAPVVDRLRHYFLTYKAIPGHADARITVDPVYGAEAARGILAASRADYEEEYSSRKMR